MLCEFNVNTFLCFSDCSIKPVQSPLIIIIGLCFVYFSITTFRHWQISWLPPCWSLMGAEMDTWYSHCFSAYIPIPSPFSWISLTALLMEGLLSFCYLELNEFVSSLLPSGRYSVICWTNWIEKWPSIWLQVNSYWDVPLHFYPSQQSSIIRLSNVWSTLFSLVTFVKLMIISSFFLPSRSLI